MDSLTSNNQQSPPDYDLKSLFSAEFPESYLAEILHLTVCDFPLLEFMQRHNETLTAYRNFKDELFFISRKESEMSFTYDSFKYSLYHDLTVYRISGNQASSSDEEVLKEAQNLHNNKQAYKLFCPVQELPEDHNQHGRRYLLAAEIYSRNRKLHKGLTHLSIAWMFFRILQDLSPQDFHYKLKIKSIRKAISFALKSGEDPVQISEIQIKLDKFLAESVTDISLESPLRNNH